MTTEKSPDNLPQRQKRYLAVTTKGAYLCVSSHLTAKQDAVISWLLNRAESPKVDAHLLEELAELTKSKDAMQQMTPMLGKGLLKLLNKPVARQEGPMEEVLSNLLASMSNGNQALITHINGLCMASTGFDPARTESISALAVKITDAIHHGRGSIFEALEMAHGLPCLYDLVSKELFTLIPMKLGSNRMVTVVKGNSVFQKDAFRDYVWALWGRYVK